MSNETKTIRIACEGAATLPLQSLKRFQGNLKRLSDENRAKLREVLLTRGFRAPFFIWKNDEEYHILDGHQRVDVLEDLEGEGYELPEFPVCFIEAADMREAKELVLAMTSQYGEVTEQGLFDFAVDSGLDINGFGNYAFPGIDLTEFIDELENGPEDFDDQSREQEDPGRIPDHEKNTVTVRHCLKCHHEWSENLR